MGMVFGYYGTFYGTFYGDIFCRKAFFFLFVGIGYRGEIGWGYRDGIWILLFTVVFRSQACFLSSDLKIGSLLFLYQ